MATQGEIRLGIGFDVNPAGLREIEKAFKQLQAIQPKELTKFNPIPDREFSQAKNRLLEIEKAYKKAFNPKLGTANVQKFNKAVGGTKALYEDLAKFDAKGINIFNRMTTDALKLNASTRETHKILDNIGKTLKNTIKWNISSSLINQVNGSLQKSYYFVKDLDKSLNDIRIVTDKSASDMDRFAVSANKAAKALAASTRDYTEASLIYYQQGLSDKDVAARTETTLKTANVTGQRSSEVSEQLTAVWNGYKVSAEEAELYIDKIAAVAASTASDLQELSTGMSKVASAASAMGVDIDKLNGMLSTVISVTRQAPESAGTAFKTIFARMEDLKLGKKDDEGVVLGDVSKDLQKMGVNIIDAEGNLRDLGGVIEEVGNKWNQGQWNDQEKQALAISLAGKRQYNNLLALFDNWDMYNKSVETSQNAIGTLQHQQDIYMDSTQAHLQQMKTSWETVYSKMFDVSSINSFADGISILGDRFGDLFDVVGGGKGALLALGATFTKVFSKQISSEIVTTKNNLQKLFNDKVYAKEEQANLKAVKEQFDKEFSNKGYMEDSVKSVRAEGIGNVAAKFKPSFGYMTPEEIETYNNHLEEANRLSGEKLLWQEERRKAKETLLKHDVGDKNQLKDFDSMSGMTSADVNSLSNTVQEVIKNYTEKINNFAEDIKKQNDPKNLDNEGNALKQSFQKLQDQINSGNKGDRKNKLKNFKNEYLKNFNKHYGKYDLTEDELNNNDDLQKQLEKLKNLNPKKVNEKTISIIQTIQDEIDNIIKKMLEDKRAEVEQAGKVVSEEGASDGENTKSSGIQKDIDEHIDEVDKDAKNVVFRQVAQGVTEFVGGIGQVAMAAEMFSNMGDILNDKTIPASQKFLKILTGMGMALPMLVSGFTGMAGAIKGVGIAITEAGLSIGSILGPLALIVGAIAAVGFALKAHYDDLNKYNKALEDAQDEAKSLNEELQRLKTSYSDFQNSINNYDTLKQDLTDLEKGTEAWRKKLNDVNGEVINMINKFPELAAYVQRDSEGMLRISQEGLDTFNKKQEQTIAEGTASMLTAQSKVLKAQQKKIDNDTRRNIKAGTPNLSENPNILIAPNQSYVDTDGKYVAGEHAVGYEGNSFSEEQYQKLYDLLDQRGLNALNDASAIADALDLNINEEQIQKLIDSEKPEDISDPIVKAVVESSQDIVNAYLKKGGTDEAVRVQQEEAARQMLTAYGYELGKDEQGDKLLVDEMVRQLNDKATIEEVKTQFDVSEKEIAEMYAAKHNLKVNEANSKSATFVSADGTETTGEFSVDAMKDDLVNTEILRQIAENTSNTVGALKEQDSHYREETGLGQDTGENSLELAKNAMKYGASSIDLDGGAKSQVGLTFTEGDPTNFLKYVFGDYETQNDLLNTLKENDFTTQDGQEVTADTLSQFAAELSQILREANSNHYDIKKEEGFIKEKEFGDNSVQYNGGADDYKEQEKEILNVVKAYQELEDALANGYIQEETYNEGLMKLGSSHKELYDKVQNLIKAQKKYQKVLEDGTENTDEGKEAVEDYLEAQDDLADGIRSIEWEDAKKELQHYTTELTEAGDLTEDAYNDIAKELTKLTGIDLNAENIKAYKNEILDWLNDVEGAGPKLEALINLDNIRNMPQEFHDAFGTIQSDYDAVRAAIANNDLEFNAKGYADFTDLENGLFGITSTSDTTYEHLAYLAGILNALGGASLVLEKDGETLEMPAPPTPPDIPDGADIADTASAMVGYQGALNDWIRNIQGVIVAGWKFKGIEIPQGIDHPTSTVGGGSAPSGSGGGGGGRGGGGGGGGGTPKKPQHMDSAEDKFDVYHDIDLQIKDISHDLEKISNQEDKLFGKKLLDNLTKQLEILEKQKQAYQDKVKLAEQEAERLRGLLRNEGVSFDSEGFISNYANIMQSKLDHLNSVISSYNNMAAEEQEGYKDTVDQAKEDYDKFKELIEEYENTQFDILPGLEDDLNSAIDKEFEIRIKEFTMAIEIQLDMTSAEKTFNDFKRKVIDGIKEDDILGNAKADLNDYSIYYKEDGTGVVPQLNKQITNTLDQLKQIDETGTSSMYGNNKQQAMEDLKKYQEELMSQLEDVEDLVQEIKDSYLDMIDEAKDKFDEQVEQYEYINELIEHDVNLIKLLSGEDSFDQLEKYYEKQEENNKKELEFQRQQVNFWKEKMDAEEKDSEAWKKYKENWQDAVQELNSSIEKSIENLIDKHTNAIDKIFSHLNNKLTSGKGLDYMEEEWDLINKNADQYLDTINSMYEIQKLENKYLDSINDTDSAFAQEKLNSLMAEQLDMLRTKEKLTQYDVDRANALYDIALKEIALKEAQQNKSKMRLRRDSQGNYSYQYVSDEDQIAQAQQELADAQNSLYNMDKGKYKENLDQIYSIYNEFQEKLKELYQDQTLSVEEREQRKKLLVEQYEELINGLTQQNTDIRLNLHDSAFQELARLYDVDISNFQAMSDEEQNILIEQMIPQWNSGIQEMTNTFAGEGGFIPTCEEAFQELDQATKDYQSSLDELENAAGADFDSISQGYDNVIIQSEELIEKNEELIDKYNDQFEAIQSVIEQMETLIGKYREAKNEATAATKAAYDYWQMENEKAQREAQKQADEEAKRKAEEEAANSSESSSGGDSNGGNGSGYSDSDLAWGIAQSIWTYGGSGSGWGNDPVRSGKLTDAYGSEIAAMTQDYINQYASSGDLVNYDSDKFSSYNLIGYDTGGYTGQWDSSGRLALLHQKELVLNKDDTEKILSSVNIVRQFDTVLKTMNDSMVTRLGELLNMTTSQSLNLINRNTNDAIDQQVHIEASFPNVNNHLEIEQAFDNLINTASQYAFRNKR